VKHRRGKLVLRTNIHKLELDVLREELLQSLDLPPRQQIFLMNLKCAEDAWHMEVVGLLIKDLSSKDLLAFEVRKHNLEAVETMYLPLSYLQGEVGAGQRVEHLDRLIRLLGELPELLRGKEVEHFAQSLRNDLSVFDLHFLEAF
jgi:hypothetical protein